MAELFSNTRRRFMAGILAAGLTAPSALAQSAKRRCSSIRYGSSSGSTIGERYEARVYADGDRATAIVPATDFLKVPGFGHNRLSFKLSASSSADDSAISLALYLSGVSNTAKERMASTAFVLTVEGNRQAIYERASGPNKTLVFFRKIAPRMPQSFLRLKQDIFISVYLPGTNYSNKPDYVLRFDKQRIARATRLAQAQLRPLQEQYRRGACSAHPPGIGCFLTTAAASLLGLADDCWELSALRRFRDNWLVQQPGGAAQIADYYKRAPAIADQLAANPQRLARLYLADILPSAIAARLGLNQLARKLYARMMRRVSDLG